MGNGIPSDKRPLSAVEALAREKPTQLMAQLRAVWPQVQQALKAGHTLRLIHKRLNMAGVPDQLQSSSLFTAAALSGEKSEPPTGVANRRQGGANCRRTGQTVR